MGEPKYSNGIECPICKSQKSSVTDKRNYTDRIWRRRKCDKGHVYSTSEVVELSLKNKRRISSKHFGSGTDNPNFNPNKEPVEIKPKAPDSADTILRRLYKNGGKDKLPSIKEFYNL